MGECLGLRICLRLGVSITGGLFHVFDLVSNIVSLLLIGRVVVGATAGIVAALLATICIAVIYIPSFISTVLKFRSGVIGSLRDRQFVIYRYAGMYLLSCEVVQ